jgi:hypothetical protein
MAYKTGTITVQVKIVGVGGKRRLRFIAFIARLLHVNLEAKVEESKQEKCPHCEWLETLDAPQSNREYWLITEMFVYLHNGKDYCDWKKQEAINAGH